MTSFTQESGRTLDVVGVGDNRTGTERSFAHVLDRGGMRRTWLRGRENVHKRYLLHVAGHNLGLLMRLLIGAGTPREASARGKGLILLVLLPDGSILVMLAAIGTDHVVLVAILVAMRSGCRNPTSSTGCYGRLI